MMPPAVMSAIMTRVRKPTGDGASAVLVLTETDGIEGVPEEINSVAVAVRVFGTSPTDRWDRPVPIGVSTGHPSITAGITGARATDGVSVYALSNNHVYAGENEVFVL